MKIRHPLLIRILSFIAACLIRLWMLTVRRRMHFVGVKEHPTDPDEERCIYAFWHESLLIMTTVRTRISVLISRHADGELITQVCQRLGIGVERGSTKKRGAEGLLGMIRCSRKRHLAITPDGPRGPRRQVQMGIIQLASLTGLPIVPIGVGYSNAKRFNSWDRFALPRLGSKAVACVGEPIVVPKKTSRENMEPYRQQVEEAMLQLTESAEAWARSGEGEPPKPLPTSSEDQVERGAA